MKNISFPGGFTVLMAVYGKDDPDLFKKALETVFQNTLLPEACLLVVDGPIGQPLEQVIQYFEVRYPNKMQCLRLKKNLGLACALNAGLKEIKTNWVVRADSDDQNLPDRFRILAQAINKYQQIQLIGSFVMEIDEFGSPLAVRGVPLSQDEILTFCKIRSPFNHMSVAYRLETVLKVGGYPSIYLKEDYALWSILLANKIPMVNIEDVLVHATAGREMYRRRGGWLYAKSEWQMQNLLVQHGIKGGVRALVDGVLRATIFLLPGSVRGFIYLNLLRKSLA